MISRRKTKWGGGWYLARTVLLFLTSACRWQARSLGIHYGSHDQLEAWLSVTVPRLPCLPSDALTTNRFYAHNNSSRPSPPKLPSHSVNFRVEHVTEKLQISVRVQLSGPNMAFCVSCFVCKSCFAVVTYCIDYSPLIKTGPIPALGDVAIDDHLKTFQGHDLKLIHVAEASALNFLSLSRVR